MRQIDFSDGAGIIKTLIITLLLAMISAQSSAQVVKNGIFLVTSVQEHFPTAVLTINDSMEVALSEVTSVSLAGLDKTSAIEKIRNTTTEFSEADVIRYFDPESLVDVSVLGDIDTPGKYQVPAEFSMSGLNAYHRLYDNSLFDANMTLIRGGEQIPVPPDQRNDRALNAGDAVLIYLQEKPPVEAKPVIQPVKQEVEGSLPNESLVVSSPASELRAKLLGEPSIEVPAPVRKSDKPYLLQSGDTLIIRFPGESGFDEQFLVNRSGNIILPEVGEVEIVGLDIDSAKKVIMNELSVYFLGLDNIDIYLQERKILVTVLGYVEQPGEVVLPSTGNIQMAINSAGGFREGALLNKIKLKRKSSEEQTVDFRRYLNTGDERYLPAIQSLDTIFVPSSPELGNVFGKSAEDATIDPTQDPDAIKVIGEVIKPGSLAFKENMTAIDALLLAGGVTRYADDEKIRVINDGKASLFSLAEFMKYGQMEKNESLSRGATVYVPIKDESAVLADDPTENPDSIKVFGEVATPGVHKYKENISIVDVILLSGGVTRYANVEQIRVIAKGEPTLFNLKAFLDNGSGAPAIEPGSTVFVPKQVDAISSSESVVYIMGQVYKPGAFETGANVKFMDILANAGGPTRYADTSSIRVLRRTGEVIKFNFDEYSEGRLKSPPQVFRGDSILVPQKAGEDQGWLKFKSEQTVKIIGAVNRPGRYPWSNNINFMDLFAYAGGSTENADVAHIKFIYPDSEGKNQVKNFNLQGYMDNGGEGEGFPDLVGGLTIVVPELPVSPTDNKSKWVLLAKEQAIYILGAVNRPGRYAFNDRLDLLDILTAADGPTPDADLSNIRVVHRNEEQERLSSVNLIKYFATGDESLLPKIKPGDGIYLNSRDASMMGKDETITVLGDVNNTGRFIYRKDINIVDLISEAGGTKEDADIENVIIKRGAQQFEFDLEGYMNDPDAVTMPPLMPGDTLYIGNDNKDWANVSREWIKDIASVVPLIMLIMGGF